MPLNRKIFDRIATERGLPKMREESVNPSLTLYKDKMLSYDNDFYSQIITYQENFYL